MKIVMTRDLRLGMRRLAEGDEIEVPDRFAQRLVAAGRATVANDKKSRKAAEAKEEPKAEAKTYKTRQIKAENND